MTNSEFLFGNPRDGDRVVRRGLHAAFESDQFSKLKSGNMGTHSLRKGSATYCARSGLSKDYVNRRGRWRTRKSVVDTYIDNTQPYPDACAAAALVGPQGPCRYTKKPDSARVTPNFLVNEVAPVANHVFGSGIAETLGCALLWAALEPHHKYPYELLQEELRAHVIQAYNHISADLSSNPVIREFFHVVGDGSQLQLVHIGDQHELAVAVGDSSVPSAEYTRRQFAAVHSEIFSLKRYMTEITSELQRMRHDMQQNQDKVLSILRRLAMSPAYYAKARGARTTGSNMNNTEDDQTHGNASSPMPKLSKRPKDLFGLWLEYEFGFGGQKPAKDFTAVERGANKVAFSRRKVFWDVVAAHVRAGYTSDVAIDKIYAVYGRQVAVTTILDLMRVDRKHGGHPALHV